MMYFSHAFCMLLGGEGSEGEEVKSLSTEEVIMK